jgi:archaellum component FlaC
MALGAIKASINELRNQVTGHTSLINNLTSKVGNLETTVSGLSNKFAELLGKVTLLDGQVTIIEKGLSTVSNQFTHFKGEVTKTIAKNAEKFKSFVQNVYSKFSNQDTKNDIFNNEIVRNSNNNNVIKTSIEMLGQSIKQSAQDGSNMLAVRNWIARFFNH